MGNQPKNHLKSQPLTAQSWLLLFLCTCLLLAGAVAAFNIAVDPFGVFGDPLLHWYSYNETNNPRAAKIAYLDQHHEAYDSYLVGCSSTSSFPIETANRYWDASFYNTIMYGADMLDCEQTVQYLVEHYEVKNILLNVHLLNGETYDVESDPYTYRMHGKLTGENPLFFYGRYAFANVHYAFAKLKAYHADTYLNQTFDVFNEQTGAYDKRVRDTEYIGARESYLVNYPEFVQYPHHNRGLPQIENCMQSVANIRDLCNEYDVNLVVFCAPLYWEFLSDFPSDQVKQFYCRLAEVTPYWDFSMSSVSFEPRYFYDAGHLRNAVGDMALARMVGDDSIYIPADFGVYVTPENAQQHAESLYQQQPLPLDAYTAQVPILMYHNITTNPGAADAMNITPERFAEHLDALLASAEEPAEDGKEQNRGGFQLVSLADLEAYVKQGTPLPDNPIVLTFDDGYLSNYQYIYPLLQERAKANHVDLSATFFPIGVSVGKEIYKDTSHAMNPHFSWQQAREMCDSGLIAVQSHTYDMHQWPPFEEANTGPVRKTVARFPGESEADYIAAFRADNVRMQQAVAAGGLPPLFAFAYPEGDANQLAEVLLYEEGYTVTLRTERGANTLVQGLPQSLLGLKRIEVDGTWTAETLLQTVEDYRRKEGV